MVRITLSLVVVLLFNGGVAAEDIDLGSLQEKLAAQEARLNDLQEKVNSSQSRFPNNNRAMPDGDRVREVARDLSAFFTERIHREPVDELTDVAKEHDAALRRQLRVVSESYDRFDNSRYLRFAFHSNHPYYRTNNDYKQLHKALVELDGLVRAARASALGDEYAASRAGYVLLDVDLYVTDGGESLYDSFPLQPVVIEGK